MQIFGSVVMSAMNLLTILLKQFYIKFLRIRQLELEEGKS